MLLGSGLPRDSMTVRRWRSNGTDGLRAQLCVGRAGWTLRSRPGRDCTADFAELADLASMLQPHCVVLDGELVHLAADGKPEFAAISRRLVGKRAGRRPAAATFVAFDVLHLNGRAVRALPYAARREILEDLLQDGPLWRVPRSLCGPAAAVPAGPRDAQLEGRVPRRLSAPCEPARRPGAWRKHKHRRNEW